MPSVSGDLPELIEYENKTYKLDYNTNTAKGFTDEEKACLQAIYKILSTEKGKFLIYSDSYGIKLNDLFGKSVKTAAAVLEERIKNALKSDDRIKSLESFSFNMNKRGELAVKFTANTIYGDFAVLKDYNLGGV